MVTIITEESQLELIKQATFACIFFKAEGCHHCKEATPVVETLSRELPQVSFFSIEVNAFPTVMQYYEQFADFEQATEFLKDETGALIIDKQGNVKVRFLYNEDGTPKMVPKVAFPTFVMLHKDEIEEDNPLGYLGKVQGNLAVKLEGVLKTTLKRTGVPIKEPKYSYFRNGLKSFWRILRNKLRGVDDKVPEQTQTLRKAICSGCPKLNKALTQCSICKCFINNKVQYREESCPIGKWGAVND